MELLLLLVVVVAPNRLGVGMEEDEVVELVVVGLLAIKENDGFGAAEESVRRINKMIIM